MPPLVFSWPYGLCFLAVLFRAFAPEFRIVSRRTEPSTSPQDAGSKRLIAAGQELAPFAAFSIAASVPSARLPHRFSLFWAGVAAIIAGSLLAPPLLADARSELHRRHDRQAGSSGR